MLGSTSMGWLMGMDSIFGPMAASTKEISSMESGTAMEFGLIRIKLNVIRGAIEWTKKKGLEFISG